MALTGLLLCNLPENALLTALAKVGAYSYSIYLWHIAVAVWGLPLLERLNHSDLGYGARLAIYWCGSLVVGVGMAKLVEVPTLSLRDRWFPSRARGPLSVDGVATK